jgi:hypothetical protein
MPEAGRGISKPTSSGGGNPVRPRFDGRHGVFTDRRHSVTGIFV